VKLRNLSENEFVIEYSRWCENVQVDYECAIENFKERMGPFFRDKIEVFFSGFSSQGDGASFSGRLNLLKVLDEIDKTGDYLLYRELIRGGAFWLFCDLTRRGYYCHEMTMQICDVEVSWECGSSTIKSGPYMGLVCTEELKDQLQPIISAATKAALEWLRDKARKLYRELEQEYEYQTSREAFIEWSEANE